jgi:hypothetical protein
VAFFITLVVLSSFTQSETLQCFSLPRNIKSFLQIQNIQRPIPSIDGLKGVTTSIVIVLHYVPFVFGFPFKDGSQVSFLIESRFLQVFSFAGMIIENFLILGGMQVVLAKKSSQGNKILSVLQGYVRFFFPVLFLMLTQMLTSPYFFNNTPFYNLPTRDCDKYWWSTLLHLQVYLNPGEQVSYEHRPFLLST